MNVPLENLSGVLPVVQVPYDADWSIDWHAFDKQVQWVIEHGAKGIALAMVSEILRLTDAERWDFVEHAVESAAGRVPVIASIGAESTAHAVAHLHAVAERGADLVMSTPPALTACDQQEILNYYHTLLEASDLPIIVQDASGYMGRPVSLEVQLELYKRHGQRVMFKPEAPPIGQHITALMRETEGRAAVFDGLGGLMLIDHFQRGVRGVMPAADLIWATTALWNALSEGDEGRALAIHAPLAAIVNLMCNLDAFLAIDKMLLVEQGVFTNDRVRGPVGYRLDQATRRHVIGLLEHLRQAVGSVDVATDSLSEAIN